MLLVLKRDSNITALLRTLTWQSFFSESEFFIALLCSYLVPKYEFKASCLKNFVTTFCFVSKLGILAYTKLNEYS